MLSRAIATLALALLLQGCVVDTEVPPSTLLTCTEVGQCPQGWTCHVEEGTCLAPGVEIPPEPDASSAPPPDGGLGDSISWESVPRAEDKEAICFALYDKGTECAAEMEAVLGAEVYALFEEDRDTFTHGTCVIELMEIFTDEELDEYMAQLSLLPLSTCDYFAEELCPTFAEIYGALPGC